ncbi:AMP-binding protein [Comamonas koreensis]|uniref:AMP-binding protein n=1 Tax=Comamonas koreensis TaxID=160825 RepID=UPI0015FAEEF7|nr:AMP-binding protein [Comamonas koreensis]
MTSQTMASAPPSARANDVRSLLALGADDAPALQFGASTHSYAQLRSQVQQCAHGLRQQGLVAGDVLGLWLPNTPHWLLLHLACAQLGITSLSLNLKLGVKEISRFIDRSACKALAFDRTTANALAVMNGAAASAASLLPGNSLEQILAQQGGSLQCLIDASLSPATAASAPLQAGGGVLQIQPWQALMAAAATTPHSSNCQGAQTCIILSSSGTTSQPKLIVHRQASVAQHAQDVAPGFGIDSGCRSLLALPLCGAFGYTAAMATLAAGACLVLHEVFDTARAAACLQREPITHMFGTNDMVDKLIAELPSGWQPQALRFFGHANFVPGLDALPARALQYGIPMVGCFGMSETFALFAHQDPAAPLPRRAQSGGFPVCPQARVRVRNLETGAIAEAQEPGELEFYSPTLMQQYLHDAQATQQAFTDDGFLRSGDLGYLNGDGGFTHISRLGDVLRIGGFLVNPAEIEESVMALCGASACQVVAVNASGSSRPVAFVLEPRDNTDQRWDEEAIKAQLQQQIARYKVPIRIFRVETFPYTMGPNGKKVKRNELRDLAHSLLAQEASA